MQERSDPTHQQCRGRQDDQKAPYPRDRRRNADRPVSLCLAANRREMIDADHDSRFHTKILHVRLLMSSELFHLSLSTASDCH